MPSVVWTVRICDPIALIRDDTAVTCSQRTQKRSRRRTQISGGDRNFCLKGPQIHEDLGGRWTHPLPTMIMPTTSATVVMFLDLTFSNKKIMKTIAATLRGSRPGVQSASLIMTSLMTS